MCNLSVKRKFNGYSLQLNKVSVILHTARVECIATQLTMHVELSRLPEKEHILKAA